MDAETVIIGAGIIGLSIAVTLKKNGVDVLLLDANEVCRGASDGNAGHIATEQVYPVADPSLLTKIPSMLWDPLGPLRIDWRYLFTLTPWAWKTAINMLPKNYQRNHIALLDINSRSLDSWSQFAQEWELNEWLHVRGSLLVCEKEKTAKVLRAHGDKLSSLGVENKWLNAMQLKEYAPLLNDKQLGALLYPKTGHVSDLRAIARRLKNSFVTMGGRVSEFTKVLSAEKQADGSFILQSNKGTIRGKKIILSAGAFSKSLAKKLTGITVPLDTERGYHLMLPQERQSLDIPVSSADQRFIMTPFDEGLRLAGTVEYAGLEAPPNMARADNLLPLAQAMVNRRLDAADATRWMGFRPTTVDSLPVIDRMGNVFVAFGHQHLGLTHAACTAKAIEALYFSHVWPFDLRPYQISRFV